MRLSRIEFACLWSLNIDCTVVCCIFVDDRYCFSICLFVFYAFFVCIWAPDTLSDFTLANWISKTQSGRLLCCWHVWQQPHCSLHQWVSNKWTITSTWQYGVLVILHLHNTYISPNNTVIIRHVRPDIKAALINISIFTMDEIITVCVMWKVLLVVTNPQRITRLCRSPQL